LGVGFRPSAGEAAVEFALACEHAAGVGGRALMVIAQEMEGAVDKQGAQARRQTHAEGVGLALRRIEGDYDVAERDRRTLGLHRSRSAGHCGAAA
jgi:hypothetical protein